MKTILALICIFAIASAKIDKQPNWPGLGGMENYYDSIGYSLEAIDDGNGCDQGAACKSGEMSVFTANFDDGGSVKVCICGDAVMDQDYMANKFSVVPIWIREKTLYITSASHGACGGAYSTGSSSTYCDENMVVEVFVHESAHNFEIQSDGHRLSQTQEWKDAIDADSCVPDNYAQTNEVEDYAQVAVTWMILTPEDQNVDCMSNQLNLFRSWLPQESKDQLLPNLKGQFQ